jgi:prolyl-tRNA synthetase
MLHSDNVGLVLPPRISMTQVVIVACGISGSTKAEDKSVLYDYIAGIEDELKKSDIRVRRDLRDNVTPGFKYNYWEIRGVPLRIEVGFRDMKKNGVVVTRRVDFKKKEVSRKDIGCYIRREIDEIHDEMFNKARDELERRTKKVGSWEEFMSEINGKNIVLAPWCMESKCEESIRDSSAIYNDEGVIMSMGAKSLCIPFGYELEPGKLCVKCLSGAKVLTLFGRSY